MLKSSFCNYSDAYILVKGTITINNTAAAHVDANNTNKKVIFKNCAPFTSCISEINNTQVYNAKDINIVMPMYNLIEYGDKYSGSGCLRQYCKEIPAVNNNSDIVGANATDSFNFKANWSTGDNGTREYAEIMIPLKNLSNFWKTLEIPSTNCEINLCLNCFANYVIV